jgi:hypothetical protein
MIRRNLASPRWTEGLLADPVFRETDMTNSVSVLDFDDIGVGENR